MQHEADALISVIVPIYNAAPWLRQCVESISAQSYRNLDIILIDDGSVDQSLAICKECAEKDSRIRIISKSNSGVSDTRNTGIKAAKGTYITFVDADDYLSADILKKATEATGKCAAALCAWNVACIRNGAYIQEPPMQEGMIECTSAITATIYDRCADIPLGRYFRASWAKLYRTDIITENKISFCTRQRIGEDALFLLEYLRYAEQITVINTVGYFYRITETSAVRRYREDLLQQNQYQLDAISAYLENGASMASVHTQTALTCLAWDMFRRSIRNQMVRSSQRNISKKAITDARMWFVRNRDIMQHKNISRKHMPRSTRLQYTLSAWLPVGVICDISAVLEKRKMTQDN